MIYFGLKKMFDLRPNRDLIDPDFTGYKLDLTSIPVHEKHLEKDVDVAQASENQFSLAHTTLFSLHNYLFYSGHTPELVFYVDESWNVVQVSIGTYNRVQSIVNVLDIPRSRPRNKGDFPVSIEFASSERAVINDGTGTFHIVTTQKDSWTIVHSGQVVPECSVVSSAVEQDNKLAFVTRSVKEAVYHSVLDVIVLDENWQIVNTQKLEASSCLYYISLQSINSLIIISQTAPKNLAAADSTEPLYKWSQTTDDITVLVDAADAQDSDVTVDYENGRLRLALKDSEIVCGELFQKARETSWSLENGTLAVVLVKAVEGVAWKELVLGDVRGVQVQTYEDRQADDVPFNAEELEEVDAVAPSSLFRFRIDTGVVSQEADLTQSQFLFATILDAAKPPALCLKSPIDGCIWQFDEDADSKLKPNHVGTFSAFGYVQASKTQRKFMSAPRSLSYVAITDAFRHIYVFRQPSPVQGALRNRTSGQSVKAVARQHLVNLECSEEVVGMRTSNSHLMVLTKSRFFLVVINQ